MNRLEARFHQLKEENKKAFIAYIMAGENGIDETIRQMILLEKMGVDIIEVGVPFSDPVADGDVIMKAGQRALERGITLREILYLIKKAREVIDIPIVLMSYVNPVYQYDLNDFYKDASECGIDGLILPDVPFEESDPFINGCNEHEICFIQFVTLTSSEERIKRIIKRSRGFIYGVTVTGVTGKKQEHEVGIYSLLEKLQKISPIPVCAGFGISSAKQVKRFADVCDGVIVGSRIIECFQKQEEKEILGLIKGIQQQKIK